MTTVAECFNQLLPFFVKAKGKDLTKREETLLFNAVEDATTAMKDVQVYTKPKLAVSALKAELRDIAARSKELDEKFQAIRKDDRVISALETAYSAVKARWGNHPISLSENGVVAYIQLSKYLAFASRFSNEIVEAIPKKGGAATNYRQLVFLPLIEAWMQITGKYPGITDPKLDNTKTGTFVSMIQHFFNHFDPDHRISGDTIQGYLKELKPHFIRPKR